MIFSKKCLTLQLMLKTHEASAYLIFCHSLADSLMHLSYAGRWNSCHKASKSSRRTFNRMSKLSKTNIKIKRRDRKVTSLISLNLFVQLHQPKNLLINGEKQQLHLGMLLLNRIHFRCTLTSIKIHNCMQFYKNFKYFCLKTGEIQTQPQSLEMEINLHFLRGLHSLGWNQRNFNILCYNKKYILKNCQKM